MPADPADLLRQHGIQVAGQPHITAGRVAETVRSV